MCGDTKNTLCTLTTLFALKFAIERNSVSYKQSSSFTHIEELQFNKAQKVDRYQSQTPNAART